MMGLYEDCIASGETPALCAATFGAPGDDDTATLSFGEILIDAQGRQWKVQGMGAQGFRLFDPVTKEVRSSASGVFQTSLGAFLQLDNKGAIVGTSSKPPPGFDTGGVGGSAPSFASSQAAQAQAEAFRQAQAQRDAAIAAQAAKLLAEQTAEENRLAEEASLKRNRLSTLSDLIQSFAASQSQARDTLANLQPDPFKFAAVSGGIAPFGVTPQQGFQQQLTDFASAPVPTADPNASLPSIESAIQGLTGANVPLSPQVFGAAEGVVIEMSRGADGSYSAVPLPAEVSARLVGENPDGTVNSTTEVMIASPQGVAVIPLGKGMQEGGFFPFSPIEFDKSTLLPALETSGIFGGFNRLPTSTRFSGSQSLFPQFNRGGFNPANLSTLGIEPGLVRFADDPTVFFRNPQTGELQPFTSAEQFGQAGFKFSNVAALRPFSREQFQFGPDFTSRPVSTEAPSAFTKFSAPIIEPTTGTLLPAPFTIASQLNKLRLTDPFTFNLLLSAYESAGVPGLDVLATVQAALPFGQERQNIGLR